jgi:hypothetical protein
MHAPHVAGHRRRVLVIPRQVVHRKPTGAQVTARQARQLATTEIPPECHSHTWRLPDRLAHRRSTHRHESREDRVPTRRPNSRRVGFLGEGEPCSGECGVKVVGLVDLDGSAVGDVDVGWGHEVLQCCGERVRGAALEVGRAERPPLRWFSCGWPCLVKWLWLAVATSHLYMEVPHPVLSQRTNGTA